VAAAVERLRAEEGDDDAGSTTPTTSSPETSPSMARDAPLRSPED
jgi:hypothetical protein